MKRKVFFPLLLAILLGLSVMEAADIVLPQRADEYVNDFAGVLTATDKSSIASMLREVSVKAGASIEVVTVNSVADYAPGVDPGSFALTLFKGWKLEEKTGKAILIFISIKDRQVTMELGSAKQGFYDNLMQKVVKARMVPNFKEGDYGRGIYEGVRTLAQILTNQSNITDIINKYMPAAGIAAALLLIIIILLLIPKKGGKTARAKPAVKNEKKQAQKKEAQDIFGGGSAGSW